MPFRKSLIGIIIGNLIFSPLGAIDSASRTRYRQGKKDFRAGRYSSARDIFETLAAQNPEDKKIQRFLAEAQVKANREKRNLSIRQSTIAQARLLLDIRRFVLTDMSQSYPAVGVKTVGTGTQFSFPEPFLFLTSGVDPTGQAEGALSLVKDFIQTHRTLYVQVICEHSPHSDDDARQRNGRRAIALAALLFRQIGLAPTQIRLTETVGKNNVFHVLSDTQLRPPDPSERELEGVLINAKNTTVDVDRDLSAEMEISNLVPAGVRRWSVQIIRLENGNSVRSFKGTSDVWVSLLWDGRDFKNRPVYPGRYRALLTTRTFSGVDKTDSLGLMVKKTVPHSSNRPAPPPKTAQTDPEPPVNRRWAHVIEFPFNTAEVGGGAIVELRQLAVNLKASPGENVVVEGFAERHESTPRELAKKRAQTIVDLLITKHGIPAKRLSAKSRDPEGSGESSRKAVAFFLGSD
jgi:hypothetical protein